MDKEKEKYIQEWIDSKIVKYIPDFIPAYLLKDKEFIITVLKNIHLMFPLLKYIDDEDIKNDIDLVCLAILNDWNNIDYVSIEMQKDKRVIGAWITATGGDRDNSLDDMLDELDKKKHH